MSFVFTKETIKEAQKDGAKKDLFKAYLKELRYIIPIDSLYSESKTKAKRTLTVAGLVALEKRLGKIDPEKVKAFVETSIEYKEVATGFFASLPCIVSKGAAKWYGQNYDRFYKREKPLIEAEILPLIKKEDELIAFLNLIQESNDELTEKTHDFALRSTQKTYVFLGATEGVGSNSCGPVLAEEYRVPAHGEFAFTFRLF